MVSTAVGSEPTFSAISENLEEGKRKVEVRARVSASAWGATIVEGSHATEATENSCIVDEQETVSTNDTEEKCETAGGTWTAGSAAQPATNWSTTITEGYYNYNITNVSVNGVPSWKTAKTYFAKWFFTLSKGSDNNGVLTVKLTNNSPKNIEVIGISVDNKDALASASVDGQSVTFDTNDWTVASARTVSNNGSSIDIQVIAKWWNNSVWTVKLTWIIYKVSDWNSTYYYKLDNTISSVGTWWNFVSSK